jgi:VanZ family protein
MFKLESQMLVKKCVPALAWASVIFITSCFFIPSKNFVRGVATIASSRITEQGFSDFWKNWWWLFVKGYHVLEFALLSVLLYHAMKAIAGRIRSLAWATLISFLYACSDEWHQTFVKGRGGKWTDVAIDCIGIGAVALIIGIALLRNREGATSELP